MSKHIGSLQVGDQLECKGPIQKLAYKANMKGKLGMIAGEHLCVLYDSVTVCTTAALLLRHRGPDFFLIKSPQVVD
jgi:hypothetical protein